MRIVKQAPITFVGTRISGCRLGALVLETSIGASAAVTIVEAKQVVGLQDQGVVVIDIRGAIEG